MEDNRISEDISSFLRFLEDAQKEHIWAMEEETRLDWLTQDYLHLNELTELTYHDRAKLALNLKDCRKKEGRQRIPLPLWTLLSSFLDRSAETCWSTNYSRYWEKFGRPKNKYKTVPIPLKHWN